MVSDSLGGISPKYTGGKYVINKLPFTFSLISLPEPYLFGFFLSLMASGPVSDNSFATQQLPSIEIPIQVVLNITSKIGWFI